MGTTVIHSLRSNRYVALSVAICAGIVSHAVQAADGPAPRSGDANGGIVVREGELLLPPGAEPPAPVELLPAAGPRSGDVVDASARAAEGMLLDEFRLEEMPFEASSGDWFWNGGWYAGGESLWMDLSRNNRRVLAEQAFVDPVTGVGKIAKFTTTAQPFNLSPGARVTIGRSLGRDYLDRDRALEFIYYGGMTYEDRDGWNAIGAPLAITPPIIPLAPFAPGFAGANRFDTWFNSDVNSWELDYKLRRRLGRDQLVMSPGGNWSRHAERGWLPALIIGPRLATVNEDFRFQTSQAGVAPTTFGGTYTINTANWLFGLNISGELISQNEFFYWGLRGRAAPAMSFVSTHQTAVGVNTAATPATINFTADGTRTAPGFIGDLTLMAGWNISPNFAVQIGYDFLWVAGIATATRQFNLDQRDTRALDAGGQTFYNGLSFGFNGSW